MVLQRRRRTIPEGSAVHVGGHLVEETAVWWDRADASGGDIARRQHAARPRPLTGSDGRSVGQRRHAPFQTRARDARVSAGDRRCRTRWKDNHLVTVVHQVAFPRQRKRPAANTQTPVCFRFCGIITARISELREVLFLAPPVCGFSVCV